MGVPKFFRYISERYPCLSELIREGQLPEFDNLYLDMNGIIHVCSHSDDEDVCFGMTEEQIFRKIFQYAETLFRLVRPNKLFFIAVDGVAPRAKVNQQRGRRFRVAREAEQKGENAKEADIEQFDSNCITPGTEFMIRLQEALRYFIKQKLSTNSMWQKCRIILSGHGTPGEGEHKIMDYIRYLKSQPDYNPNTRHCLYGLDADLIMLGICTHERYFSLLREEVTFGAKNDNAIIAMESTRFYLLHIGLLREYLELEFDDAKKALQKITEFTFDIEKILDDWVLMSFLVGNDYIPHLPNMHITSNALPLLYSTYILVLPKIGYLNESGILNLSRFELYMKELANNDIKLYQINKQTNVTNDNDGKKMGLTEKRDEMSPSKTDANDVSCNDEDVAGDGEDDDVAYEDTFEAYKRAYYIKKLKYREVTEEVLAAQTECYIRAIQWALQYYYYGCPSWGWYYPHHYAPFMSDIKNFQYLDIKFEIGEPFLPYQQLLAVLPVASKELLPLAYRKLMTSKKSLIHHFYPTTYETDLNGKKSSWEALVLIPFIDEKLLIAAMDKVTLNLSDEERKRNKHKPMLQYDYCEQDQGSFEIPHYEKLEEVYCTEIRVNREEILIPKNRFVLAAMENARHDIYFPGFPTFKYFQYTATLNNAGVRVFQSKSRNNSVIITVENRSKYNNIEKAANDLIGKEIFVNWPHLVPAIVVAVSDENCIINRDKTKCQMDPIEFKAQKNATCEHYMFRMGINLNPDKKHSIHFLIHVNLLIGHTYVYGSHGRMSLEKHWSNNFTITYPDNIIVKDITAYNQNFILYKSVEEVFTVNSTVFLLNTPDHGCPAQVIDSASYNKCQRIKVHLHRTPQPNFNEAVFLHENSEINYMYANAAAAKCGIGTNVFVRITGSILVVPRKPATPNEKVDIGLQLKFSKKNVEIPGYTKRRNRIWLYSDKVCMIVSDYYKLYPKIFELIHKQSNNSSMSIYYESDLNEDENETDLLHEMMNYIKNQKCADIVGRTCDAKTLETETLQSIVKAVDKMNALKQDKGDIVELLVNPNKLYKHNLNYGECSPDEKAVHNLFDRIIIVKENITVPLGSTGTIISISEVSTSIQKDFVNFIQLLYLVLFDKPFSGGLSIENVAANRAFRIRHNVFLNITYGTENSLLRQQTVPGQKEKQKKTIPMKNIWNKFKFSSEESPTCENNVGPILYPEFLQQKQQQQFYKKTPLHQLQRQQLLLTQSKVKDITEELQKLSVNNTNADEEQQFQLVNHKKQRDLQSTTSGATNVMVEGKKNHRKLNNINAQADGQNIIIPKKKVNNKSKADKPQKLTTSSKQPAAKLESESQKKNKDTENVSSSGEQSSLQNSVKSNNKIFYIHYWMSISR